MAIKRSWEDDREIENLAMANCLMLLSRVGQSDSLPGRVFHCKTCNKGFKSFQALGGHRASHKRPRTTTADGGGEVQLQTPVKVMKTHECSVCGVEFALGQALGGHMRRHRDGGDEKSTGRREVVVAPRRETVVVGRGFGLGLGLDLNLTPDENGLRFWSREVNTALAM